MGRTSTKILAVAFAVMLAALGCAKPSTVRERAAAKDVTDRKETAEETGDKATEDQPFVGGRSSGRVGGTQAAPAPVSVPPVGPKGSTGSTVGITDETIKLGFVIVNNNEKLLSNYGVRGGAIGDTREQVQAVVDDVNSRGIFGRKIVPVLRQLDATGDSDQYAQICTGFTQDDKVFAVLNPWNPDPGFASCLAKAGTFLILDSLDQEDAETIEELNPYLISGLYSSSRAAVALATGLHQGGYFTKGARVGIVRPSNPKWERVSKNHLRPTLKSFGVTPVGEISAGTSTINDAVLYMNDKDVDHVIFLGARGGNPLFFMNAAQAQGYFPLYGLASPDGPSFLAQNAPYTQLRGAKAVGWWPGVDVLDSEGPPLTAAEKRCLDVHRKGGTDYGTRTEGAAIAMAFCDMMWLVEEGAKDAGRELGDASWTEALQALGTGHPTTLTFGTKFGAGQLDGAYRYRPMAYDDSPACRCFKYTGGVQTVPR